MADGDATVVLCDGGLQLLIRTACTGLFAGKPAPTGISQNSNTVTYLWERVYPRRGRHRQHKNIYLSGII
ncbi:conserved protein of unknown function [Pseudomonas sp. JV551A1]|nr:conserved protein of unknown function [Pseudomonas sp. JV551A1]